MGATDSWSKIPSIVTGCLKTLIPLFLITIGLALIVYVYGLVAFHLLPSTELLEHLLSSPHALVPAVVISVLLYRLRSTHPILYGSIEIFVGAFSIWFVAVVPKPRMWVVESSGLGEYGPYIGSFIGFLGGMYIIIRGLDNIQKFVNRTVAAVLGFGIS